jgi:hypothetical protein
MEEKKENWKMITLLIGGAVGLAAGVVAAMMFIQRAEAEETKPRLTAGEGIKVGLGLMTLLRLIADLGTGK